MNQKFPKYNRAASTGERGVNLVSTVVSNNLQWIFRRTHTEHDFGIDGYIDIVTHEEYVTGRTLAIQIKSGASYLQEKTKFGYVYRGDKKHLNYLINHPVPVIIVLCDLETSECYWTEFDPSKTKQTNTGWKINVPFQNKLGNSYKHLVDIAGPAKDYTDELNEFWMMNNLLEQSSHILFIIDPEDIENFKFDNVLGFTERLVVNQDIALSNQGKVEIGVYGWDEDPRELFEIEIVKRYIEELDHKFDNSFFFLRNEPKSQALKLFACCTCDAKWEGKRAVAGTPGRVVFDKVKLGKFLERHWVGLNMMAEWLQMSIEENKQISYSIMRGLGFDIPEDENV